MARQYRRVECKGECNGKPKTRFLEDSFKSEVCTICSEVISYEKPEKQTKKKLRVSEIQITSKEVRKVDDIKIIERGSSDQVEVGRIYCEKWQETVKRIPDRFVNYVFTSPPYNVGTGVDGDKYQDFKDNSSQQQYFEDQVQLIDSLLRITTHHIFYNNQMLTNNRNAIIMLKAHFQNKLKEICIWNKKIVAPASTAGVMNSKFELILIFSNDNPSYRVFSDANFHGTFNNVIELRGHDKNEYADVNKAVFPLPLVKLFMDSFGKEGDIWYDPYGGTGTVAVAAISRYKNWIISEMSKNQCVKVTMPRIKKEINQLTIKL